MITQGMCTKADLLSLGRRFFWGRFTAEMYYSLIWLWPRETKADIVSTACSAKGLHSDLSLRMESSFPHMDGQWCCSFLLELKEVSMGASLLSSTYKFCSVVWNDSHICPTFPLKNFIVFMFMCISLCMPHVCRYLESRRIQKMPWSWNCRRLWVTWHRC